MGTGTITREQLSTIRKMVADQFQLELETLGGRGPGRGGLSKKSIGDLIAGHTDGMRNIVLALRAAGVLEIVEAEPAAVVEDDVKIGVEFYWNIGDTPLVYKVIQNPAPGIWEAEVITDGGYFGTTDVFKTDTIKRALRRAKTCPTRKPLIDLPPVP